MSKSRPKHFFDDPAEDVRLTRSEATRLALRGYGWEDIVKKTGVTPDFARGTIWRVYRNQRWALAREVRHTTGEKTQ